VGQKTAYLTGPQKTSRGNSWPQWLKQRRQLANSKDNR